MKSEADVDLYVFKWHFGFRVANLWLVVIGGSIINKLDGFIEKPGDAVDLLGTSIPGKSQVGGCRTCCTHTCEDVGFGLGVDFDVVGVGWRCVWQDG